MLNMKTSPDEPFWMDEPNPYSRSHSTITKWSPTWWAWNMFLGYAVIASSFIFVFLIILAIRLPLLWILVALEAVFLAARIFFPRFKETREAKAARIQRLARDKTGADFLGSALHTAGHPLLQVSQPVVLALKDGEFAIYGYDNPTPIDTLRVKDLQAVELVVFDDDHVPHTGVIDNSAQALQLTLPWQRGTCTCSFRRMYKVRPVEWYQAIQKARLTGAN